ncbi:uncharacterized protein LOC101864185 isoform X2 [Aplysia californica]|nr:uncharacterized protein LOC101864185 isoform X2 [Aplysia californica]
MPPTARKPLVTKRKRVLIVGSGASGTAAAYALGKHPDKFDVQVWEKLSLPGGVATSEHIEGPGDLVINDGVQGGCPTYRNTLNLMSEFGFSGSPVHMMISFGKGPTAWTNYTKTDLIDRLKDEIKRFGRTLKIINKLEFFFIFIPISKVLKWFGYSDAFCYEMVFPLTALFFGTGNQTPNVSAAIVARVFLDDDLRLFDYDPECLLSQTPEMFAFPKLRDMYQTIMRKMETQYHANRAVASVIRRNGKVHVVDDADNEEVFDEIIFACDAETVLRVLKQPSYLEKKALGNVRYYNDVTLTHEDDEYMEKHYELHKDVDQYFIRTDPNDRSKLEMSFNLSNYQPHLKDTGRNIYQTIFLDDKIKDIWTIDEIDKSKVRFTRWWRQFSHTWKHFAFTVPLWRYVQGTKHTWYCGSYTLINTHEIGIISGFAAACRLGASYPFIEDKLAREQFEQYLLMIHGKPRRYGCNGATFLSILFAPLMFIFVGLALFVQFIMRCCGKDV